VRDRRRPHAAHLRNPQLEDRPQSRTPWLCEHALPRLILAASYAGLLHAQGIVEHETRALVLVSNDNGLLQDAELAWDVRGSPLRSFPWQVQRSPRIRDASKCGNLSTFGHHRRRASPSDWKVADMQPLHVVSHRSVRVLQDQSALLQRFFEHAPMPDQGWRVLRGGSGSFNKAQGTEGER